MSLRVWVGRLIRNVGAAIERGSLDDEDDCDRQAFPPAVLSPEAVAMRAAGERGALAPSAPPPPPRPLAGSLRDRVARAKGDW